MTGIRVSQRQVDDIPPDVQIGRVHLPEAELMTPSGLRLGLSRNSFEHNMQAYSRVRKAASSDSLRYSGCYRVFFPKSAKNYAELLQEGMLREQSPSILFSLLDANRTICQQPTGGS